MRIKLISCEVLRQEFEAVAAKSVNEIDITFLPRRIHDVGTEKMVCELQKAIDEVDETLFEAIVMGYGLCNNGIVGLKSRTIPLVIPRAHDCITLFMGSKEKYQSYFNQNPGVYYLTSGWLECDHHQELDELSIQRHLGMERSYQDLVEEYGEDNAQYIYETLCDATRNYNQITYIQMGVETDSTIEQQARQEAEKREWKFEKITGDISLLQRLLDGVWKQDECLVSPPRQLVLPSHDELIIKNTNAKV